MNIEYEWLCLSDCLKPGQETDGRRCFYAVALLILSDIVQGNDIDIAALTAEIQKVLKS